MRRSIACRNGILTETLHSELDPDERRGALRRFARGAVKAIAAPKVLDEGIDVPAADFAVILAASRTRRQMVQRMGRVLRRKNDGRLARFAILYVDGTSEDPSQGAHEQFLEEVTSVADDVRSFGLHASAGDVCRYLNDYRWTGGVLVPRLASEPAVAVGESSLTGGTPTGLRHELKRGFEQERGRANPSPIARSAKPPKRVRDMQKAARHGLTVEQLLAIRRAEAVENLRLHEIATTRGITVKHLRRELARR